MKTENLIKISLAINVLLLAIIILCAILRDDIVRQGMINVHEKYLDIKETKVETYRILAYRDTIDELQKDSARIVSNNPEFNLVIIPPIMLNDSVVEKKGELQSLYIQRMKVQRIPYFDTIKDL